MARRRRTKDRLATYVLLGSAGLLAVAVVVLVVALTRGGNFLKGWTKGSATTAPHAADPSASRRDGEVPHAPSGVGGAPKQPPAEKPLVLTSDELRQRYARNAQAADQELKGRLLEVTGTVSVLYQEAPLIGIGFGKLHDVPPPVLCELDRQQVEALSRLRPGQTVTVRGVYMGTVQGGFIGIGNGRLVAGGT
jgi:hypothetical protein